MPRALRQTILVVEDESGVRILINRLLTRGGHTVIEARDAVDAETVAAAFSGTIHTVLSDVVLPGGISGMEAVARIRVSRPDIEVVMMSGYTRDEALRRGVVEHEVRFLEKPFTAEELIDAIELTKG